MILSRKFLKRSAVVVARNLIGKFLVRKWRGMEIALMITEAEAYEGPRDKASHAFRGLTARNKSMFGPAGYWYVYFTYGMHWMLNIVTGRRGYPSAVLIRGAGKFNGPAKLTKTLRIDKKFNNLSANRRNSLWIEDRGARFYSCGRVRIPRNRKARVALFGCIKKGPRVGVSYAGPVWSKKTYRFYLE